MTEKPRDSSLRDAFVGILMTVGPFFGVRYRPPRVEIPVVTSPSTESDESRTMTDAARDPSRRDDEGAGDDGVVI